MIMRRILTILVLALAMAFGNAAFAQQDCQEVDCPGQCGRFVDENQDGFCDHGFLSEETLAEQQETERQEKTKKTVIVSLSLVGAALVCGAAAVAVRKKRK